MDYYTEANVNVIYQWYASQDSSVQVGFDFVLQEVLGTNDLTDSKQFKPLKRQHLGLWEIVLEVRENQQRRQLRPVGFWNYGQEDFILVSACEKSGRFTIPQGAFDYALDIVGQFFHEGRGAIREHDF